MNKLWLSTWEAFRNNKNWETACFLGHRISGIALTVYVVIHIFVVSPLFTGFDERMNMMHSPVIIPFEILLFAAVVAHMLNGIRVMLGDFFGLTKEQRNIFYGIFIIGFVVFAFGAIVMFANFIRLSGH